ncbi:hypothetical protein HOT14_gp80 [Escherichia phage vB_EcoS_IME347]|uniref:Uncharacterized protein n=1 Tax=Escherichia phage vB_EcoS_IME347 TaxID=2496546 RepID=A0A2S1GS97_9CAUD|nr:hypothetical protein HOT14_gp80 [Escherichia phage vB_EcoS_IME347]AWD92280.1 hypothetical protein [Escherichia phage vB_EcoS_IME347]
MITYYDNNGGMYRIAGGVRKYNKVNGTWEPCYSVSPEDLSGMQYRISK